MWDDADLRSCIHYLRGSTSLRIPAGWRELLPTSIWWAPQIRKISLAELKLINFRMLSKTTKKNDQIWPYLAIFGHIWDPKKWVGRREPEIYWHFIEKNPKKNVEKKPIMGCFPVDFIYTCFGVFDAFSDSSEWKAMRFGAPCPNSKDICFTRTTRACGGRKNGSTSRPVNLDYTSLLVWNELRHTYNNPSVCISISNFTSSLWHRFVGV